MDMRAAIAVGRDVILMLIGAVGIIHQEFVGPVKIELLALYGALLGVPGAANAYALIQTARAARSEPATDSPPSPSAQSPLL